MLPRDLDRASLEWMEKYLQANKKANKLMVEKLDRIFYSSVRAFRALGMSREDALKWTIDSFNKAWIKK